MVYKAILKKRPGIEVFDNREGLDTKKASLLVAVKELQGMFCSMIFVTDESLNG